MSLSKLLPNSTPYIYCKNSLIVLGVTNLEIGKAVFATCSRKKELKSEKILFKWTLECLKIDYDDIGYVTLSA
jgi:hypothetical protein